MASGPFLVLGSDRRSGVKLAPLRGLFGVLDDSLLQVVRHGFVVVEFQFISASPLAQERRS